MAKISDDGEYLEMNALNIEIKHLECGGDFINQQCSAGENGAGYIAVCDKCKTRIVVGITMGEGDDAA